MKTRQLNSKYNRAALILAFSLMMIGLTWSQESTFIYMNQGEFYKGCDTFNIKGVNYPLKGFMTDHAGFYITPTTDQCPYDGQYQCFSCGTDTSELKTVIIDHLSILDSVGINTIRLVGLMAAHCDTGQNMLTTPSYYYIDNDTVKLSGRFELDTLAIKRNGDLLQLFIDIIKEQNFDIKLIPLMGGHGVEVLPDDYGDYLARIARRFKNEPTILGYDLYNEPIWFSKDVNLDKYDLNEICYDWYDSIKRNSPSHHVTIGTVLYDIFRWDVEVLPLDFVAYHPYPKPHKNDNWEFEWAWKRFKVFTKFIDDNYSVPFIIGETGLSALDSIPNCQSPHPVISTEADQSNFADSAFNYTNWYNQKGLIWWKYKDTPWNPCGQYQAIQNYHGLVYFASMYPDEEVVKPVADVFIDYNFSDCEDCQNPETDYYYSPTYKLQNSSSTVFLTDTIRDSNGSPVANALLWASIKYMTPNNWENESSFAISRTDGSFILYTKNSNLDDYKVHIKISKPGFTTQYIDKGLFGSLPTSYAIDPLNQSLLIQKENYDIWTIDNGDSVTWDVAKVPGPNDVVVDSGGILTIKAPVYFNEGKRLIIEPGGKLIIDEGGRVTTNCDGFWCGIEVRGSSTAQQVPTEQGWIKIINGGIVEHSEYGIFAGKSMTCGSGYASGYSGGIIQCNDAKFLNNKLSIYLTTYTTATSASTIANTVFEVNDDYLDVSEEPEYFAKIQSNTGVGFTNCTFENTNDSIDDLSGVYCYNSTVSFLGDCIAGDPCTQWDENEFTNLKYGIKSYSSSSPTSYLTVQNSIFDNNFRGVYISATDNCRVTSNTFEINEAFVANGGCGLYLDNCTGYWVEDNDFLHETGSATGIGIVVNNSGTDANEIYRNTFGNLQVGVSAQAINKGTVTGLQILCNEFSDIDSMDVFVSEPLRDIPWGIAVNQGVNDSTDQANMAGNLFDIHDYNNPDGNYDDLNNEADYFHYHYPENPELAYVNSKPIDITENTVNNNSLQFEDLWDYADGCPSQLSSGGGYKSSGNDLKETLISLTDQANEIKTMLAELVDGGNTITLDMEVEYSQPPEAVEIYNELLDKSPYLSETVISTSIEKETVLPNSMIRDVMVANTHSSHSNDLMEQLDERDTPMPDYMKAQVLEAGGNISMKTSIESQLASLKLKETRVFNKLVSQYLIDLNSIENSTDSIAEICQIVNDKNKKYRLAMIHLYNSEYDQGLDVLSNIPLDFDLSESESDAHDLLIDYYQIVQNVHSDNRTLLEAAGEEITQLAEIEESDAGIASAYARSILIELGEMEYLAPIQVPNIYKSQEAHRSYQKVLSSVAPSKLQVFPNPAKDYCILEYHLDFLQEGRIEIRDIDGRYVQSSEIRYEENQITVTTQDWKPGLYIATLFINGKYQESCKFTLAK